MTLHCRSSSTKNELTSDAHDDGPGEAEIVELEAVHGRHPGSAAFHLGLLAAAAAAAKAQRIRLRNFSGREEGKAKRS